MLVLTRKVDEVVCVGDDILIKVVMIKNNSVRLAIEAPENMNVKREELISKERVWKKTSIK